MAAITALDDIGATVVLYRLWRGFPDLRLRDLSLAGVADQLPYGCHDHGLAPGELDEALGLGTQAAPGLASTQTRFKALVRLDLAAVSVDPVDW